MERVNDYERLEKLGGLVSIADLCQRCHDGDAFKKFGNETNRYVKPCKHPAHTLGYVVVLWLR